MIGGFMIDMDGTVYKGRNMIPGADAFISDLRSRGIPFVFLTNNSSHRRSYYHSKLLKMGFDVSENEVLTSTIAAARYILSRHPGERVYAIASPEVTEELREAGLEIVQDDPDIILLTFDRTITYEKINKGYRYLRDGAAFIATHPDDLCPTEDSYDIDIGPFIRMFEQMCGSKATVIGKPKRLMLEMAAMEMGVDPGETAMVGDRLYTDIRMAQLAGTRSVLVLSGETSRPLLESSDVKPTYVVDSVADIPALLDGMRGH
ncbi:MAG: HAD-IIA family hydrolase [Candidatus Methanomethylophilaceae archaeon]|nr:HAD-IIA family hydrolase [Candidatus Methanomethylophilaceae archaeon]